MATVEIGAVFNGCRVVAGPVPHGVFERWALVCLSCAFRFGAKEDVLGKAGCDACALAYQLATKAAFKRARQQRSLTSRRAHGVMNVALRSGALARPAGCTRCGRQRSVNGHHESYTRPLDVTWLCDACHAARHAVLRETGVDPYLGTEGAIVMPPRPISVPAGYRCARIGEVRRFWRAAQGVVVSKAS